MRRPLPEKPQSFRLEYDTIVTAKIVAAVAFDRVIATCECANGPAATLRLVSPELDA
jgi:hypothetical protein